MSPLLKINIKFSWKLVGFLRNARRTSVQKNQCESEKYARIFKLDWNELVMKFRKLWMEGLFYISELLFHMYHLCLINRLTPPSSHSRLFYDDVVTESRILDEVVLLHEILENSDQFVEVKRQKKFNSSMIVWQAFNLLEQTFISFSSLPNFLWALANQPYPPPFVHFFFSLRPPTLLAASFSILNSS